MTSPNRVRPSSRQIRRIDIHVVNALHRWRVGLGVDAQPANATTPRRNVRRRLGRPVEPSRSGRGAPMGSASPRQCVHGSTASSRVEGDRRRIGHRTDEALTAGRMRSLWCTRQGRLLGPGRGSGGLRRAPLSAARPARRRRRGTCYPLIQDGRGGPCQRDRPVRRAPRRRRDGPGRHDIVCGCAAGRSQFVRCVLRPARPRRPRSTSAAPPDLNAVRRRDADGAPRARPCCHPERPVARAGVELAEHGEGDHPQGIPSSPVRANTRCYPGGPWRADWSNRYRRSPMAKPDLERDDQLRAHPRRTT